MISILYWSGSRVDRSSCSWRLVLVSSPMAAGRATSAFQLDMVTRYLGREMMGSSLGGGGDELNIYNKASRWFQKFLPVKDDAPFLPIDTPYP